MARVNATALISAATDVADRASYVRRDPAVQKAATEACGDLAQAAKSVGRLTSEVSSAWARAGRRGPGPSGQVYAA